MIQTINYNFNRLNTVIYNKMQVNQTIGFAFEEIFSKISDVELVIKEG
jgi:predicted nuclease of restriction endonuclease-like RecB superfamily